MYIWFGGGNSSQKNRPQIDLKTTQKRPQNDLKTTSKQPQDLKTTSKRPQNVFRSARLFSCRFRGRSVIFQVEFCARWNVPSTSEASLVEPCCSPSAAPLSPPPLKQLPAHRQPPSHPLYFQSFQPLPPQTLVLLPLPRSGRANADPIPTTFFEAKFDLKGKTPEFYLKMPMKFPSEGKFCLSFVFAFKVW